MPRVPRLLLDEVCYHILTRGNNRAAVFFDGTDRQRYGQLLATLLPTHQVQLYHYCLMTNHVHLVVRATAGVELRLAIQRLNLTYAKYLRRTYGHVGHVWQDRFKSLLIADDVHLLQCGAYLELNPVRAKLVTDPAAYPWSSYRLYAYGQADALVTLNPAYLGLGRTAPERQQRYRQFVAEQVSPLPRGWFQQLAVGAPDSLAAVQRRSGTTLLRRPRGRPRKQPILPQAVATT